VSAYITKLLEALQASAGQNTSVIVDVPTAGTLIWIGPEEKDVIGVIVSAGAKITQLREKERQQRPTQCSD